MIDNTVILNKLLVQKQIRLCDGDILHNNPKSLPPDFDFSKIEGMLLGLAVGDSLGATSEGISPEERHNLYKEITDYVPGKRSMDKPVGVPTDDTQLTFWTLKRLIYDNGLIPDNLAKRFCRYHINGIGNTVKTFIRNYKDNNVPWYKSGEDSLGNGALMRISPIVIPYIKKPHMSLYSDAALAAMITHNSFANTSSNIAFVHILWSLLSMDSTPEPQWWANTYSSIVEPLEKENLCLSNNSKAYVRKMPLWRYTDKVVNEAIRRDMTVIEACNQWGSGANLFETVPSVLFILAKHAGDPEQAIIRAVNDTKDNDTIAAIVGSAVGALHGLKGIPSRWIKGLTGRTRYSDDGEAFKLMLLAKKSFWL